MNISDIRLKATQVTVRPTGVEFEGRAIIKSGEKIPEPEYLMILVDSAPQLLNALKKLVSDYKHNRYASFDMSAFFEARDLIELLEYKREA